MRTGIPLSPRVFFAFLENAVWFFTLDILLQKGFPSLRHQNAQIHIHNVQQPNQTNQLNIAWYKKAIPSSAIWLQLTLVACYLTHGVAAALVTNSEITSSVYQGCNFFSHLSFLNLNSLLSPILYSWKLEGRKAGNDTIRQVLCKLWNVFRLTEWKDEGWVESIDPLGGPNWMQSVSVCNIQIQLLRLL